MCHQRTFGCQSYAPMVLAKLMNLLRWLKSVFHIYVDESSKTGHHYMAGDLISFVAKIVPRLEKAGIVTEGEGARGGHRLARVPEKWGKTPSDWRRRGPLNRSNPSLTAAIALGSRRRPAYTKPCNAISPSLKGTIP
jgi:hypothetical protein